MGTPGRKLNTLKSEVAYRICKLLERDREIAANMTLEDLARRFSAETGIHLTAANMVTIRKMTGIACGRPKPPPGNDETATLRRALAILCQRLGENFESLMTEAAGNPA